MTVRGESFGIKPGELLALLARRGWDRVQPGRLTSIWARDGVRMLVPVDDTADDYERRGRDVLQDLAARDGLDLRRLRHEVEESIFDSLSLRVAAHSVAGTTTLEEGRSLLMVARQAWNSGARLFARRSPDGFSQDDAKAFVRRVRLGQTERGSYIVRTLAPVIELPEPGRQFSNEPTVSPTHTITRFLAGSLGALREVVPELQVDGLDLSRAGAFLATKGVTAEICRAISRAVEEPGAESLQAEVKTSDVAAPPLVGVASFTVDDAPALRAVANVIADPPLAARLGVEGKVIRLHRRPGAEHGFVRVMALVDGRTRQVSFSLGVEDYEVAVEAHRAMKTVAVYGPLETRGTELWISNPASFLVMADRSEELPFEENE